MVPSICAFALPVADRIVSVALGCVCRLRGAQQLVNVVEAIVRRNVRVHIYRRDRK